MRHLPLGTSPDLLVGASSSDDAAVWRIDVDRALVATVDFITPVVDDARTWGRVAATNAVSDVYAMGGRPLFALNLVGWAVDVLPTELLGVVLEGGSDVAAEAGFVVAGGHTVDDPEPKYGMAVIGEVDPARMLTNTGLEAGQDLVMTKPIGVGILTTAIKAERLSIDEIRPVVESMCRLNDVAARVAVAAGATGCTDVTGFGLLGHLGRMADESGVTAEVEVERVPLLPGVAELLADGVVPGGTRRNLAWASAFADVGGFDESTQLLIADAQTSGGLVFGCDPSQTRAALVELAATGHTAARIGRTTERAPDAPAIRLI